jgi:CubicO group peptidase (beta-lactamase class C family)
MKKLIVVLILILPAVALLAAYPLLKQAAAIPLGYSAKQMCSGVFVAQLPEEFILEHDIQVTMAFLGQALPLLSVSVDHSDQSATASLLGLSATALYRAPSGCTLYVRPAAVSIPAAAVQQVLPVAHDPGYETIVDAAFQEPVGGGRNTLAVLVAHRGTLVAERYRAPVTADTPLQGWSMNKSLMATFVGIQVARAALDIKQPVRAALQGVAGPGLLEAVDPQLRLDHLLHMESGFEFSELYQPGDDVTAMLFGLDPMWHSPLRSGLAYSPGEYFHYSSGDTNLAAYLWLLSLQGEAYSTWIEREFAGPLGLAAMTSEGDISGVPVGSSFTYMTGRDWLRVGQFWLDEYHGRSRRLPDGWQREAVRPRASSVRGEYGRGFWLNVDGVAYPDSPATMFRASGFNGQHVAIFPEDELVVVRLGLTPESVDQGDAALFRDVVRRARQL